MRHRAITPSSPPIDNLMQYATGTGSDRTTSAQKGKQWRVPGQTEVAEEAEVEEESYDPVGEREGSGFMYRTADAIDMVPEDRGDFRERGRSKAAAIDFDEGEEFTESTSEPDMDEGSDVGMAPYVEEEAPAEYWAESMGGLPDRMAEAVEGRAVSPKAPEPERKYTDSEITAMMEFSMTGRGRERLPKEMFGLDTLEVHDALKPIRERARKASAPRRARERRDRIANRRGFHNRGGIRDSDTPSYDFTFEDVKEFFNFKDGGLTSLNQGGIAKFDNGSEVIEEFSEVSRSVPPSTLYGREREQRDQENKDAMLGMMETEERDPKNPQEVAEFMREGFGEHASPPGYPSRTLDLRQREKYERGQRAVEDALARQQDQEQEPDAPTNKESAMGAQISKFLEMYEDTLNQKLTKGYPKRIPLSDEQRKQGMIGAIAAAMMAVKSDKFGGTDFSGAGPAAAAHVANFRSNLDKRRKEEIAARAAHRKALLEGVTTTAEVFKNMSAGEKDRASAALDIIKAQHPDLELYKIITPELMKAIGDGTMGIEQLQGAVEEAVAALKAASGIKPTGQSGLNTSSVDWSKVKEQS